MNETCNVVTIRADDDELLQVLTYHLGNDVFAINVSQVKEVLRYKIIASINDTPEYVKGIINLRTKKIKIINVHSLFGLVPEDITINTRIIIIEADGPYFGIVVDNIADVVYIYPSNIHAEYNWAAKTDSKFNQGVFYNNNRLIRLVDYSRLLSEDS